MTPFRLDVWIIVIGILSAVSCAIPGNFLMLRRMSLMGDAISHAVLPGIAIAFIITQTRASAALFVGAIAVTIFMNLLTEWIRSKGRVEANASLGAVFSIFFAIGLVALTRGADAVDLDPSCVLYGALELAPLDYFTIGEFVVPRVIPRLLALLAFNCGITLLLYKEMNIVSFDPGLAQSLGIRPKIIHHILMIQTAVTVVTVFEMVGSILVIAMLIVPPATAYLLTNRLRNMIVASVVIAMLSAIGGYLLAIYFPPLIGFEDTVISGGISVAAGTMFAIAMGVKIIGSAKKSMVPR